MSRTTIVDILLVEDNPHDAELTIRALKKNHLANPVHVVEDGQEAIDFLFGQGPYAERESALPPKVILLDLKLPKRSGLEVLEAIRADERTRRIPGRRGDLLQGGSGCRRSLRLGANSYVVKRWTSTPS